MEVIVERVVEERLASVAGVSYCAMKYLDRQASYA